MALSLPLCASDSFAHVELLYITLRSIKDEQKIECYSKCVTLQEVIQVKVV